MTPLISTRMVSSLSLSSVALAVLFTLTSSSAARAQSAQERAGRVDQEIALEKDLRDLEKTCGKKLSGKFNWKKAAYKDWKGYSLSSYCTQVVSQLRTFCKGERERAYIRKHVRGIRCQVRPAKSGGKLWIKDGVIYYGIDLKQTNTGAFVYRELMRSL